MTNIANKVDVHVGERIRARRVMLGLTQEHIAQALRISYQQIQKYETAANRVSAGRLYEIAETLECETSFFFDDFNKHISTAPMEHGGKNRAAIELVTNYHSIEEDTVRASISALAKSLANRDRSRVRPDLENAA